MPSPEAAFHGVLLFDKPLGLSSNAALQQVRKLYNRTKAGHTGTLDPLATGLLPVCLGEATKYSQTLLDADKIYEATIRLGFASSTGDAEGRIEEIASPDFTAIRLQEVLDSFTGPISQTPPMHSALKRGGRPLYEYARAGEEMPREPREVTIRSLELLNVVPQGELSIRVACSKGTYIRVLAEDIGQALACGGYLLQLRRTRIGELDVADAMTVERLERLIPEQRGACLLPVDSLLKGFPEIRLDHEAVRRVCSGLPANVTAGSPGPARLYDTSGRFLGLGEIKDDGTVAPKRMIANLIGPESTVPNLD